MNKKIVILGAITLIGLIGFILGIIGFARPAYGGSSIMSGMQEMLNSNAQSDLKTHYGVAGIGGIIAFIAGLVSLALGGYGIYKERVSVFDKRWIIIIGAILATTGLVLGAAAVAMNQDLNDITWLTKMSNELLQNTITNLGQSGSNIWGNNGYTYP